MTEKKEKTSTAKKVAKKVVDVAKEIANQPMQEQELMQGKVPQEATPEPKAETPAAEQRQAEKNVGIELGNKHSINVQTRMTKSLSHIQTAKILITLLQKPQA